VTDDTHLSLQMSPDRVALAVASVEKATGHLPLLDDHRLQESLDDVIWISRGAVRTRRAVDLSSFPRATGRIDRAVVATLLYRGAMADQEQTELDDFFDSADEVEAESQSPDFAALRRYLDMQSVRGLEDDLLLWELQAAGVAAHYSRVHDLCDQIAVRLPHAEGLPAAIRCLFLGTVTKEPLESCAFWMPDWADDSSWIGRDVYDLAVILAAAHPAKEALGALVSRTNEATTSTDRHALIALRGWLEHLREARALTPSETAIEAFVSFALGPRHVGADAVVRAAKHFQALAETAELPEASRPILLKASAACFLKAGHAELAERPLVALLTLDEARVQAHSNLMMCYHLQGKDDETFALLERLTQLEQPPQEELFASLALQYGLEARQRRNTETLIAAAALASPLRPFGERLLAWSDPVYARLSAAAQAKWWAGLFTLCHAPIAEAIGDEAWGQAAACFAEGTNLELRERLFKPFCQALGNDLSSCIAPDEKERIAISRGKGTLGQHLVLLEAAFDQRSSQRPLERRLAAWLRDRHPRFVRNFPDLKRSFSSLRSLRNSAAHETIAKESVKPVHDAARELLLALQP
jgi:Flp pilus assembly protein TadD